MSRSRRRLRRWALLGPLGALACQPNALEVVGAPGGVYRPDAGCAVEEEGASACPGGAQLGFESADPLFATSTPRLVSNVRVTCRRSFCGTGALAFRASYRWREGTEPDGNRLGELRLVFPEPVEMHGKELSMRVTFDPQNTPMNALIAVIYRSVFRKVDDVPLRRGWTEVGDLVGPGNRFWTGGDVTTVPVTELRIQVYLATPVRSGGDTWTGDVYIDEVGWR